jgi:hypothetical protein
MRKMTRRIKAHKEEAPYKPDRTFLAFVDTAFLESF